MTFYERLLDELKYKGLTIATLAKEIEVADYLQVSVSWLVSGQGEKLQHSYREMSESLSEIANKNSPIDANNGLYSVLFAKIDKLPARPQND